MSTTRGLLQRTFLCVLGACLFFLTLQLNADDNNSGNNKKPSPTIGSLVSSEATLPEFSRRYLFQVDKMVKGASRTQISDVSKILSKIKFYESGYIVLTRLVNEIVANDKGFSEPDSLMIDSLLGDLQSFFKEKGERVNTNVKVNPADLNHQKESFMEMVDVSLGIIMEYHSSKPYFEGVRSDLVKLKNLIENRTDVFPYLPRNLGYEIERTKAMTAYYSEEDLQEARAIIEHPFYREQSLENARERLDKIKDRLDKSIIEQPEAIEALLDLERDKYLFSERESPEVVVFMGLPGTGKDTIAEAYIRAIHPGSAKAIEKHLYRFQVLRSRADQWSELGSATGYKGSGEFPAFFDFIVNHSGGRYIKQTIKEAGSEKHSIIENPKWKGTKIAGTMGPEDAVVFLNEFHDWAYITKNEFAKEFIEKGIVTVSSPNGGLKKLYFPVNIIIASNDGIDLIADRHLDGRPRGRAQGYEELMVNWRSAHNNRRLLKSSFMKTQKGMDQGEEKKGTSEEVASRLQRLVLLRPLSPEGLQKIASIHLNKVKSKFLKVNENVGQITLSWKNSVLQMVQEYLYDAEESARPIKDKIQSMIESTLKKAVMDGEVTSQGKAVSVELDIKANSNGTSNLEMEIDYEGGKRTYASKIERTEEVKFNKPLSGDQVQHLIDLEERINKKVFGVENISKKLAKAILNAKIRSNENVLRTDVKGYPAQVFSFFGLSSTGKTELTKVLAEELTGKKKSEWVVDANHLQTEAKWQEFFGTEFFNPNERSEFQKEYDRRQGKMVIVLDELANVRDKSLLKHLYEYFREAEVGERSMKHVTFVITGNAGEEWYQGVPKELPELLRHFSMLEIYRRSIANIPAQEHLLLQYFPEALLKRIGMERTFFFSPLNFENIRRLTKLKLNNLFKKIYSPNQENHWWNVYFKNKNEAQKILMIMEREGFTLDGQGDSIRRFIEENFASELNQFLLRKKVPIGEKVELSLDDTLVEKFLKDHVDEYGEHKKGVYLNVKAGNVEGNIFIQGKANFHFPEHTKTAKIFTAYHEAGHELVRAVFMKDRERSEGISIIPGVTEIGMQWIVYAGIAKSEETSRMRFTEEAMLRRMAVLFGGEVAETLTSKNYRHGEGKSNDIERASQLARAAILEWGLNERFGRHAKPPEQSYSEYMATLSDSKKQIYEEELDKYLKKARSLAVEAILSNWTTFVDMGKSLAEIGDMSGEQVREVYKRNKTVFTTEVDDTRNEYIRRALKVRKAQYHRSENGTPVFSNIWLHKGSEKVGSFFSKLTGSAVDQYETRDAELLHKDLNPKSLKRIEDILEQEMKEAKAKVDLSDLRTKPLGESKSISCKAVFPSSN